MAINALDFRGILVSSGVAPDKVDDCMEWAFGPCWSCRTIHGSHEAWNVRHSDLFILTGTEEVIASLKKIAIAYLDSQ